MRKNKKVHKVNESTQSQYDKCIWKRASQSVENPSITIAGVLCLHASVAVLHLTLAAFSSSFFSAVYHESGVSWKSTDNQIKKPAANGLTNWELFHRHLKGKKKNREDPCEAQVNEGKKRKKKKKPAGGKGFNLIRFQTRSNRIKICFRRSKKANYPCVSFRDNKRL